MKVNTDPTSVQLGQLDPISIITGAVLLRLIVGPAQVVRAYWLPEESLT